MLYLRQYEIDERGDTQIVVKDHVFRVSSSVLSDLSPRFAEVLCSRLSTSRHLLTVSESPLVFHQLLRVAHGFFVPQADISLDTLMRLADAAQRYEIPPRSRIYDMIQSCFTNRTLEPWNIPPNDLPKLLFVAKTLGAGQLQAMLFDIYQHVGIHEVNYYTGDQHCGLLLASIMTEITRTRSTVATSLVKIAQKVSREMISSREGDELKLLSQLWGKAIWILTSYPSLDEVDVCLEEFKVPEAWKHFIQVAGVLAITATARRDTKNSIRNWTQHGVSMGTRELQRREEMNRCIDKRTAILEEVTDIPTSPSTADFKDFESTQTKKLDRMDRLGACRTI